MNNYLHQGYRHNSDSGVGLELDTNNILEPQDDEL
jgi:hypothetical protein